MTKATPQVIIKEPKDAPIDTGLKGGPVKPVQKSWRELSGQRRTFGAPRGGWPEFTEDGKVKRQTSKGGKDMATPKGYAYVCFECAKLAGIEEEYTTTMTAHITGMCDICEQTGRPRMGMERDRYDTLREQLEAAEAKRLAEEHGETPNG